MAIINWFHIPNSSSFITFPNGSQVPVAFANSPVLSEIYEKAWLQYFEDNKLALGLEGYFAARTDRLEINRFDSMANTPYTEWAEWGRVEVVGYPTSDDRSNYKNTKQLQTDLEDYCESMLDNEFFSPDEYIEQVMDYLGDIIGTQGWSITGWRIADFKWENYDYDEQYFTVSAGDGSSHTHTGAGEQKEIVWDVKTDMSGWQIVKL